MSTPHLCLKIVDSFEMQMWLSQWLWFPETCSIFSMALTKTMVVQRNVCWRHWNSLCMPPLFGTSTSAFCSCVVNCIPQGTNTNVSKMWLINTNALVFWSLNLFLLILCLLSLTVWETMKTSRKDYYTMAKAKTTKDPLHLFPHQPLVVMETTSKLQGTGSHILH